MGNERPSAHRYKQRQLPEKFEIIGISYLVENPYLSKSKYFNQTHQRLSIFWGNGVISLGEIQKFGMHPRKSVYDGKSQLQFTMR